MRNEAVLAALRRGENVHVVAAEADLSAPTVRIIAMGGGLTLTPTQRARPAQDKTDAAPARTAKATTQGGEAKHPRRPETFAQHLTRYERRNTAIVAALRDPDRTVAQVCAEFGVNEATVLHIGWHHGAWQGLRRPQGDERERRNAAVVEDIRSGTGADALTKRWGLTAAHLETLAREAGLPTPAPPPGSRACRTRVARLRRDKLLVADLRVGMNVEDVSAKYDLAPSTVVSYARANGVRIPRPPRPASPPSARDQELVRRAAGGETFTDLARAYDLSRERVRQIVWTHGATTAKDLRDERAARQTLAREEQLAKLAADRPDLTYAELADQVRLPADRVVVLLGAVEAARRAPLGEEHRFDVPTALRELRDVYRVGGFKPLTGTAYDKHRRSYAAGSASLVLKFGSWGAVCAAANICAPEPKRRTYERQWTTERCLSWVAAFLLESTSVKASDFAAWLDAREGPSVATVRNRCGLWGHTLRGAAALVTTPGWQPPDTPLRAAATDDPTERPADDACRDPDPGADGGRRSVSSA